jgi:hypothetical protein
VLLHRPGCGPPWAANEREEWDAEVGAVDRRGQCNSNYHEGQKSYRGQPRRPAVMLHALHQAQACPFRAPIGSSGAYGSTISSVLRFVRFVLLSVMTLLVLGLVVAVGTPETGPLEKAVAALAIVGAVVVAGPVRRIGSAA